MSEKIKITLEVFQYATLGIIIILAFMLGAIAVEQLLEKIVSHLS